MQIAKQFNHAIATNIAMLLTARSRRYTSTKCDGNCLKCLCHLEQYITQFVTNNQKIQFVLPAFPAKSPNKTKTASRLPDLGEELALFELNQLCRKITLLYRPGAEIIICSDGRVFNDLLAVTDTDVTNYMQEILAIIKSSSLSHLRTYNLDYHYKSLSFERMRCKLMHDYSDDLREIMFRTGATPEHKHLFNGMHRFIFEDFLTLNTHISKNQVRKLAKERTYLVIQRSNAWSNLINTHFKGAIRLSIHPQPCCSSKFGIMLLRSDSNWATPWHRVVLQQGKQFTLVKRVQAEQLQANQIFKNGKFSHYRLNERRLISCSKIAILQ
jgi:L-tyrosine isonitrile synthase